MTGVLVRERQRFETEEEQRYTEGQVKDIRYGATSQGMLRAI